MTLSVRHIWLKDLPLNDPIAVDLEPGETIIQIDAYEDPQRDNRNVRIWIASAA